MIRKANKNDHSALVALFIEENIHNHGVAPDRIARTNDVLTIAELEEFIEDESAYLSVYELNGQIVALILATHHKHKAKRWKQERNFVYIDEIIVAENYRDRGIASSLISSLMVWSGKRGVDCIDLHVWHANQIAKVCYKKLGFNTKRLLMTLALDS